MKVWVPWVARLPPALRAIEAPLTPYAFLIGIGGELDTGSAPDVYPLIAVPADDMDGADAPAARAILGCGRLRPTAAGVRRTRCCVPDTGCPRYRRECRVIGSACPIVGPPEHVAYL